MMIVPLNDELVIEARIQPRDIDQVAVGQLVTLRPSAAADLEVGLVEMIQPPWNKMRVKPND